MTIYKLKMENGKVEKRKKQYLVRKVQRELMINERTQINYVKI